MIGETEHQEQLDNFPTEAEWRLTLPPHLQPVALRYGKDHFVVAFSIGTAQEAINLLVRRTAGNRELAGCLNFLAGACTNLASYALNSIELDAKKLAEIHRDIQRATLLAGPAANDTPGKIIVPS